MDLTQIEKLQLVLLKKINFFYKNLKKKKISNYDSATSYFSSFSDNPGYALLKFWISRKKFYNFLYQLIKNFLLPFYTFEYKVLFNNKYFFYDRIILSWSYNNNFNKNGTHNSLYFNVNSNLPPKTLWILIHLDDKPPKKISNNIVIIYKSKKKFKIVNIFKNFKIKNLTNLFYTTIDKNLYSVYFGNLIYEICGRFFNKDLKELLILYEGQPFQNILLKKIKCFNKNIKTTGYIHAFPPGLPSNFYYREGAPDKIILTGKDQYYCFNKKLNWNKKKIRLLKSSRFIESKKNMSDQIYLPMTIFNLNFIIEQINLIYNSSEIINNLPLRIKNHPTSLNSKIHLELIEKIQSIINNKKNLITNKKSKKFSVFIGSTSAVIEALERNVTVIHITQNPIFDVYTKQLWPNIKVEKINNCTYKYLINGKNNFIKLGEKNKTFMSYFAKQI